ncbi:hypothetical protein GCM10023193_14340 [Planotetraspora kaengkrachanensis]|uniref:Uncharacterized protein n=1 Tax=Planotetraspora kaengkrachanensis TaxID=575193 RepID=A0A8J3PRG6_9ACTN|nr:hypothetical protein Pka01_10850 [Planotetraspora kaengkrachanensis]
MVESFAASAAGTGCAHRAHRIVTSIAAITEFRRFARADIGVLSSLAWGVDHACRRDAEGTGLALLPGWFFAQIVKIDPEIYTQHRACQECVRAPGRTPRAGQAD